MTALIIAIKQGHTEIVQVLVNDAKADVNIQEKVLYAVYTYIHNVFICVCVCVCVGGGGGGGGGQTGTATAEGSA